MENKANKKSKQATVATLEKGRTPVEEESKDEVATKKPEAKLKDKDQEPKASPNFEYFEAAKVVCACGTTFTVGSTKPEIHIEVCSRCPPFFTGKAKFVDTEGRVEAFQRRTAAKKAPKEKKETEKAPERPRSLKEMLEMI